jgi:hypothetical protein
MLPGGITEVVWHFAGYLKIIDDIARERIAYDESLYARPHDDYVTPRPDDARHPDLDEFDSRGLPGPEPLPIDDVWKFPHVSLKLAMAQPESVDDGGGGLPRLPLPHGGGGGGGGYAFEIKVVYDSDAGQSQIEIRQYNNMLDNDGVYVGGDGSTAFSIDAQATLQTMVDTALGQVPMEWQAPQHAMTLAEFVKAHDQDWAARDGDPDAHTVEPGYYRNGELLPEPPSDAPDQSALLEHSAPAVGEGIGQTAVVGDNIAFNAALIVDLSESGRSLVVMGDYYKVNAIFQTNSIMDRDSVATSGGHPQGEQGSAAAIDNQIDNLANFVQHPGIYETIPAYSAGPQWHVDVVEGDFYSVRAIVQTNYLSDNDIVAQKSADTHYEIHAGENELGNLAMLFDGSIKYDLIIVEGAYHGMNVIFQHNVLLNNDTILQMADGDVAQSVAAGNNALLNAATIENYGNDNFQPMTPGLESLVSELGSGATSLDPIFASYIAGSGGVLNVLYVKGDYYDVNAIWQTNIVSDVNVIAQFQQQPSAAALAYYSDGTPAQSVVTGHDKLSNDAAIIDVGATNTHVNGETYNDTVLIQANLLPDQDPALHHDTQALVSELVAFIGDGDDDAAATPSPAPVPLAADDTMASVMH